MSPIGRTIGFWASQNSLLTLCQAGYSFPVPRASAIAKLEQCQGKRHLFGSAFEIWAWEHSFLLSIESLYFQFRKTTQVSWKFSTSSEEQFCICSCIFHYKVTALKVNNNTGLQSSFLAICSPKWHLLKLYVPTVECSLKFPGSVVGEELIMLKFSIPSSPGVAAYFWENHLLSIGSKRFSAVKWRC